MRACAVILMAVALAGCETSPEINMVNGAPFLMGDAACARYRSVAPGLVQCFTADDAPTELRRAMNPQEVQVFFMQRQMQAQQMQGLNQSIQQLGQSFQPVQSQGQFVAPQVMPVAPPGGNQIRCIRAGIYTNCRY
ncbi:hypothetical protein ACFOD4_09740 [Pseudoroseomonas globiformis]|uniref:Lipoprotein n=1 Tax=Teichococcus globiformis TaxID=2307229 RepID=A0ABV7FY67_9PROT